MTEEAGWVALGVKPELDRSSFGTFNRQLDTGLSRAGKSAGSKLGGILGKTALATAGATLAGGYAAFRLGQDAFNEARDAQRVAATTEQIIKSTGKAANLSAKQIGLLASRQSKLTGIDDELVQSGQNLLLTFKKVREDNKKGIFSRASLAALDLFKTGFGSVESSSKMLGKALNDPLKGITALSRAGVTFTEQQIKQIEVLVETGKTIDAQDLILKEVESQVGGVAIATATATDKMSVSWGNFKEGLGTALLPVIDDAAEGLTDLVDKNGVKVTDWITKDAIPAVKDFVEDITPLVKEALPAAGDALGIIADAGKKALPYVKGVVEAFNDMPKWAQTAIVGGGAAALLGSKLLPNKKGGLGSGVLSSLKPVPVFVTNMGAGGLGVDGLGGGKNKPKGKLPFLAGASPFLLPLALGGDSADTAPKNQQEAAYKRLMQETGELTADGLFDALASATKVQLRDYRKVLKEEFGFGFKQLEGADFSGLRFTNPDGNGWLRGGPLPPGLTAGAQKQRERALDSTFTIGPTKGQNAAERDFLRLIGYRNDLVDNKIEPEIKVLGADAAQDSLRRTIELIERAQGLAAQGIGPGRTDAPAQNVYNGPVQYTDDAEGRRRAANRARQASMDGVNAG